ncbi:MAG: GNAT family N-acetyltransferase [Candidatus Bathyarchaeia archaeon]|jgi:ribosomal protein S18 acetylase RimI-like enzyme
MTAEFSLRQMLPTDESRLKEIAALSFSRLMGFFAVHSLFSEAGQVLVMEVHGTVVGFAKLIDFQVVGSKFGCVLWIAVHPDFRRKGVANALTTGGIRRLKHDSAKAVFASAQRQNTVVLTVLSRSGFRRIGFLELRQLFGWRVFQFYRSIWLAPGEVVLIHY